MIAASKLKKCWILAGPTAVGKSAISTALAKKLDAEIISMDSMAVYRGMDIGTAKPSAFDRESTPHHLIDVVDPHEDFSVANFLQQSERAINEILTRDRTPMFVGGTGLYLRSVLRGVFDGPEADWELRCELEEEQRKRGTEWLHQLLIECDPVTANRLHPNDVRRVIRAIEVFRVTGKPISDSHDNRPLEPPDRPIAVWLSPPREWLYERINRRVDNMIREGLVEEVQRLLASSPSPGKTARQGLGYREIISHLNGELRIVEAIDLIKTGTRQFAKRQHTWFRGLEECSPVAITGTEDNDEVLRRIEKTALEIRAAETTVRE